MGNKKVIMVLALVFMMVLFGAYALYRGLSSEFGTNQLATNALPSEATNVKTDGSQATDGSAEASMAPDFTVYDDQGNPVKLSDFLGKPVVVNFWASWCGPCKGEMPEFEAAYHEYDEQVHFLMVNMTDGLRETVESASEFIAQSGYTFPVYFDSDTQAASVYSVWSIPATYFIDADGHAIAWASGALDANTLQQGIDMILP